MTTSAPRSPRDAHPAERPRVLGPVVDEQTRCIHHRGERDVVALKFACCGAYYPCHACHEQAAGHPAERWAAADLAERAVLCGVCGRELRIAEYLSLGDGGADPSCPACAAEFNPGCARHHDRYFAFPHPAAAPAAPPAPQPARAPQPAPAAQPASQPAPAAQPAPPAPPTPPAPPAPAPAARQAPAPARRRTPHHPTETP